MANPAPRETSCLLEAAGIYVAFALVTIGILHCVLGFLCIQEIREWSLNALRKQKQIMLQAKQISKHKEELEELMKKAEEGVSI